MKNPQVPVDTHFAGMNHDYAIEKKHMEEARKERVPCDIVKSRCDIDNAIE